MDEDGSIWWRLQGVSCKALHTDSVCVPCAINVWVCLKLPGTAELGVLAPALPSGHLVASSPRTPRDTGGTFQHCCDLPPPAPFPDHGVVSLFWISTGIPSGIPAMASRAVSPPWTLLPTPVPNVPPLQGPEIPLPKHPRLGC